MATLPPVDLMSTHTVPVASLMPAQTPNSVQFSGNATVKSRVVRDPVFGRPSMLFLINLEGVEGVTNSGRIRFNVTGEEHIVRPLAPIYNLGFNFVVNIDGSGDVVRSRLGMATLSMTVNENTGVVTSLTASLGAP